MMLCRDAVSVSTYTRYHARLADNLARFTDTLALMLSGEHKLLDTHIHSFTYSLPGQSFRTDSLSTIHMELQRLVSAILETVVEAKLTLAEGGAEEAADPASGTYEDSLALAVINCILYKYNEDLELEPDPGTRDRDEGGSSSRRLGQQPGLSADKQPAANTGSNKNYPVVHLSKAVGNGCLPGCSYVSPESSSSSSSSDSSSLSSEVSSTSTLSSSSSSVSSSTSSPYPPDCKAYDPTLELYLSERGVQGPGDNWSLEPSWQQSLRSQAALLSPWTQRLNVHKSLCEQLRNLTDDVKTELEVRNRKVLRENLVSDGDDDLEDQSETEKECTERQFRNSVLRWSPAPPQLVLDRGRLVLKLGAEVGESSTDDANTFPVVNAVQRFESMKSLSRELLPSVGRVIN